MLQGSCFATNVMPAGLFFMIDMMLGFHTGYVISYNLRKRVVMNGKQVAKWYAVRGSFWVDFLSSVAWITQVSSCLLGTSSKE